MKKTGNNGGQRNPVNMQEKSGLTPEQDTAEVKDLPPANPFNEPLKAAEEYPDGFVEPIASQIPSETIVEHPLSPTDSNPNPHGNRDEPFTAVATKGKDGETVVSAPEKGTVQIEGIIDGEPVHLGDGRTIGYKQREHVTKEVADTLVKNKQAKRV